MTDNFDRAVAALTTIPGLTVIETSEESTLADYPLPAAVVDFSRGSFSGLTEDNANYIDNSTLEIVLHVAKTEPRSVQRANLKTLFRQALLAFIAEFDEVTIENGFTSHVPFGRGEAYACGYELLTGEQNLD